LFRILCGLAFLFCSLLALASLFAPLSNTGKMSFRIGTPEAAGTQQTAGKDPDGANTKNKTIRVRFSVHAGGEEDQAATPAIEEKIKPGFRWIARPLLFSIMLFWSIGIAVLYRLFKLYEQGMIFTPANVQCIKWMGVWGLAAWALSNVIELSKLITCDSADVNLGITSPFFAGILVLLISWIMEEGGKIQEEHALTV
jgi:hypothetical protein